MTRIVTNFLVATFLLTVYGDWALFIGGILIFLIVPIFRTRSFRNFVRYASITIVCFILASLAYLRFESNLPAEVRGTSIISTWQITADLGGDKYAFTNTQGSRYLMSKTGHVLGESLRLVGNIAQNKQISTWSDLRYQWFNFSKRLRMKGYAGALFETNSIVLSTWSSLGKLVEIRQNVRATIVRTMTHPNGQVSSALAWALWMFVGDKSEFSETQYQTLIQSGLVHLVAVSGGNIVMLITFLTFVLFFVPFYPRLVILLLAVLGYGMLCGMDSSVLRAVIMWTLSLIALLLGKPNLTRRALAIACIAMILYNPYFLIYDVWFSLSFWAVVGIVLFEESTHAQISPEDEHKPKLSKSRFHKALDYVWKSYIKPSIWATIWVFPVLIFFMDKINLASIVGNLLVLPVVPLIMIGSFFHIVFPWFLGVYIIRCLEYLGDWILWVSNFTATHGIILSSGDLWIKYVLVGLTIAMIIAYHRRSGSPKPPRGLQTPTLKGPFPLSGDIV